MDKQVKLKVEDALINKDDLTDEEMIEYFVTELNLPLDVSKMCLKQRALALGDPKFMLKLKVQ